MRTKEEIQAKIQEFVNQKRQIRSISLLEGNKDEFIVLIESIKFLDKHIDLLKWVLNEC